MRGFQVMRAQVVGYPPAAYVGDQRVSKVVALAVPADVHSAPPHKIAIPQTASAQMVVAVPMIAKARK